MNLFEEEAAVQAGVAESGVEMRWTLSCLCQAWLRGHGELWSDASLSSIQDAMVDLQDPELPPPQTQYQGLLILECERLEPGVS